MASTDETSSSPLLAEHKVDEGNVAVPVIKVKNDKVTLRQYLMPLVWILPIFISLGISATYWITKNTEPVYRVSATVMLTKSNVGQSSNYEAVMITESLARTYAKIMTSTNTLEQVANQIGEGLDAGELKNAASAEPVANTQIIELVVEYSDPKMAANIANRIVSVFAEQVDADQLNVVGEQDKVLEAQMNETELKIAQLQEEIKIKTSQEYDRRSTILNQSIIDLEKQIEQINQEIEPLQGKPYLTHSENAELAQKESERAELYSLLKIYQEQSISLSILGPKSVTQNTEINLLTSELEQYRRTYSSLTQTYWTLKTTRSQNLVKVVALNYAEAPSSPSRPNLKVNLLLGFSAGFGLGILCVFLFVNWKNLLYADL